MACDNWRKQASGQQRAGVPGRRLFSGGDQLSPQFLRHHAAKWNINPKPIASTGGSAGAGTSRWLAFHDNLADPQSEDPIARQSTRLTCVVVSNGQSSYDPRFAEKIGIPRPIRQHFESAAQ